MGTKISELQEYTNIIDTDVIPIVDVTNSATKKITKKAFQAGLNIDRIVKTLSVAITENTDYTVPQTYTVGKNDMQVYFEGCLLIKDENYVEIGTEGESSTIIQFLDWDVPSGSNLEFLYK